MSKHSRSVARSPRKNRKKISRSVPTINPNTAGVDIGATEIYVAVPADRDPDSVRSFGTFTEDLHALAAWLKACGVTSVAMESTSVYWIPLFLLLEEQGFEVCLVNARHVKNVPGRKTDVVDCQWLQYLHSVGLLRGSFHPPEAVSAVRSVLRHRGSLVRMAASHIQHMQKALTQMNLHLHHVISDITGKTGLLILDAILAGERDPATLAQLRDSRVRASQETIAKALVGTWRREHLFTLRQSLAPTATTRTRSISVTGKSRRCSPTSPPRRIPGSSRYHRAPGPRPLPTAGSASTCVPRCTASSART